MQIINNQTYQGVDAGNYSIHDKNEEDLVVCMADAVIYPNAMVILTTKRQHFLSLSRKSKNKPWTIIWIMHTIRRTHLLQTRQ